MNTQATAVLGIHLIAASLVVGAIKQQPEPVTPPAEAAKNPFSLQLNLDYTTGYYFHGIVQEDSGLILQPAAKLTFNAYEKDDFKIEVFAGNWNSFHGQKTGAPANADYDGYWYEADLFAGIVITKDKWSLTTTYTFFTSPSDVYNTVQELDFNVAFDDSDLLGKWALNPHVLIGIETSSESSDGTNSNGDAYLEIGIEPGCKFEVGTTEVTIAVPATIGLSLHDYYQNAIGDDDTFGFAQIGVKASIPLPFGTSFGSWSLSTGVSWLYLGDHTTEYNNGHRNEIIGTVGVQVDF